MDSSIFFKNIEAHFSKSLPFVVYSKPNNLQVKAILQKDATIYTVDDFSESGFVFAPFNLENKTILIPLKASDLIVSSLETSKNKEIDNVVNTTSISEKEKHIKLVEKGVDTINNSVLKKVVLSRNEVVNKSFKNPLNVFKRLLQAYPEAFVYCWYHPKVGLWIGATPETLLQLENSQFKTMALAGTQKYLGTLDVNWQLKEQEEQQFVTNSIKKSLLPLVERLKIAERETVKAGNLLHLKTTISGTFNLQKVTIKKLLLSLHPTPAVCGLPKDKALQFIKENENYSREFYTGFLGELHFKETKTRNTNKRNVEQNAYNLVKKVSHLFVNLRCAKLQSSQAQIYVGGGITKDSVAENEWHETVNKAQTIKRIL